MFSLFTEYVFKSADNSKLSFLRVRPKHILVFGTSRLPFSSNNKARYFAKKSFTLFRENPLCSPNSNTLEGSNTVVGISTQERCQPVPSCFSFILPEWVLNVISLAILVYHVSHIASCKPIQWVFKIEDHIVKFRLFATKFLADMLRSCLCCMTTQRVTW